MNMKINNLILVLSLSIMTGCTAETIETTASNDFALEKSYGIEDVNAESTNPHAKNYYNLLKTVILATNSNQPQTRGSNTDNTEENPLVEKLESINILTETGDSISFFSMEEIEQTEFLEDWATLEANNMSEKLSLEPELETYIKEENEIVAQTIQEEAIQTRNGSIKIKNNDTFFKKIKERMENLHSIQEQANTPATRIAVSTEVWYCAKKEYGINVSSWWATMVSPSGLYLDSSTYVRKEVK